METEPTTNEGPAVTASLTFRDRALKFIKDNEKAYWATNLFLFVYNAGLAISNTSRGDFSLTAVGLSLAGIHFAEAAKSYKRFTNQANNQ